MGVANLIIIFLELLYSQICHMPKLDPFSRLKTFISERTNCYRLLRVIDFFCFLSVTGGDITAFPDWEEKYGMCFTAD